MRKIRNLTYITRKFIRENTRCIFLFGDNLEGKGLGGQAMEMRGEPNVVGIPTKKKPSMTVGSFFTDDELDSNKVAIDQAFNLIPDEVVVYIPSAGIGTGLSMLEDKAPLTFQYLKERLEQL